MKIILLVPFLVLFITAGAQESNQDSLSTLMLEEVQIIAHRVESLPGAGQYIDAGKLKKLNQTDVNNVLRTVPGVNIRDEDGYGLRPNIGLRGTPVNRCAKITLMEDGILIAPAPYSDPAAYYFPTFARMYGVEVLKGSSQIKYGPYTIGGAINLLSTPIPNAFKGYAQCAYGSFNTHSQRFYVGDSRKNFDYLFELNRQESGGFKDLDNGGNTGFLRYDMMGKMRWHSDPMANMTQAATLKWVQSIESGNETYLGLTYDDYIENPRRRYAGTQKDMLDMTHNDISLNYSCIPLKNVHFNATVYHTNTFRDWARANTFGGQSINSILTNPIEDTSYNIMAGRMDGAVDHKSAARNYQARGIQANTRYLFHADKITQKAELGIRYHVDESSRYATISEYLMQNGIMTISDEGVQGNSQNQVRNARSWATFLNYEIQYQNLKISSGIRYENIEFNLKDYGMKDYERLGADLETATNQIDVWLPGIGFNYSNKAMNIFGGIHRGFSPPGMPALNGSDEQADIEYSLNYELGYRHEANSINTQLVCFFNDYSNLLGSDNVSSGGVGTGELFNAGKAIIKGIELSLEYDVLQNSFSSVKNELLLSLAYTYTHAKFHDSFTSLGGDYGKGTIHKGDWMPFITPNLLTSSISYSNEKYDLTLSGRYVGDTRVKPGQGALVFPSSTVLPSSVNGLKAYFILDFSANFRWNKVVTLYGLINNITNSRAIVANVPQGYRPNMPLALNLGLKLNF